MVSCFDSQCRGRNRSTWLPAMPAWYSLKKFLNTLEKELKIIILHSHIRKIRQKQQDGWTVRPPQKKFINVYTIFHDDSVDQFTVFFQPQRRRNEGLLAGKHALANFRHMKFSPEIFAGGCVEGLFEFKCHPNPSAERSFKTLCPDLVIIWGILI